MLFLKPALRQYTGLSFDRYLYENTWAKGTILYKHNVARTELMANKWTTFDGWKTENKSISLDTFRF